MVVAQGLEVSGRATVSGHGSVGSITTPTRTGPVWQPT